MKDCERSVFEELITQAEKDLLVNAMIDNYDSDGRFYKLHKAWDFLKEHLHNNEFFLSIEEATGKSLNNNDNIDLYIDDFDDFYIEFDKEQICESILTKFERIAMKKRSERFFLRINVGAKVDFNSCSNYSPFMGKIEFYKDGAWGIAETDGAVLIKNHIIQRPSQSNYTTNGEKRSFCIIQDRDTEKYGVLSKETIKEVIHCLYQEIQVIDYSKNSLKKTFYKAKYNDKWGCFDENYILIVDFKYADINIKNEYIECGRDGQVLCYDINCSKFDEFYAGKNDLYDFYGNFLLGGYDYLDIVNDSYLLFYWGASYENYKIHKVCLDETICALNQYKINYDDSVCLILNSNFQPFLISENGAFCFKGLTIESKEKLFSYASPEILLKYSIRICDSRHNSYYKLGNNSQHNTSLFSLDFVLEQYPVDQQYLFIYQIKENGDEHYYPDCFIQWFNIKGIEHNLKIKEIRKDGIIVKDHLMIISSYSTEHNLLWRALVNETGLTNGHLSLFRWGYKCGFYSRDFITEAKYDAISINSTKDHIVVAIIDTVGDNTSAEDNNPNIISVSKDIVLHVYYYELKQEGELESIPDDWEIFNPTKQHWFPESFLMNYYEKAKKLESYNNYSMDSYINPGWSKEDLQDAFDAAYEL